jgi:hypothetical protein
MGYELDQECLGTRRFAFCAEDCVDGCILCEPPAHAPLRLDRAGPPVDPGSGPTE